MHDKPYGICFLALGCADAAKEFESIRAMAQLRSFVVARGAGRVDGLGVGGHGLDVVLYTYALARGQQRIARPVPSERRCTCVRPSGSSVRVRASLQTLDSRTRLRLQLCTISRT
eukprot:4437612-Prymnesium_polylepis.1